MAFTRLGRISAQGTMLSDLGRMLARLPAVSRRVLDGTGLSGRFDFDLEWTPLGPAAPVVPTVERRMRARRSSLLQEQLDLKLESTKETIPVLVIDSVNKPSAN
jgi:bla regulator protein blaR1